MTAILTTAAASAAPEPKAKKTPAPKPVKKAAPTPGTLVPLAEQLTPEEEAAAKKTSKAPKGKKATITEKTPAKAGKVKKEKTAPGVSVHSTLPVREPKWNERRKALVMAMRALGASSTTSAVLAEDIAKKMGTVEGVKMTDRVDFVKIILDVYRPSELLHNGFAASVKHEGERVLRYYLTKKGATTKFPTAE